MRTEHSGWRGRRRKGEGLAGNIHCVVEGRLRLHGACVCHGKMAAKADKQRERKKELQGGSKPQPEADASLALS